MFLVKYREGNRAKPVPSSPRPVEVGIQFFLFRFSNYQHAMSNVAGTYGYIAPGKYYFPHCC